MDFEKCKRAFDTYVHDYDLKDEMIALKYYHSYAVSDLMVELAFRLGLKKDGIELAKIIGLLHDIGRFEQLKKFDSFSDKNVDHADRSCNYLFNEGHIRDFVEDNQYDTIIEKAIRYHNKLEIPELGKDELLFTKMIRDMDKVDIYKQCAVHFDNHFNADEITKEVLEELQMEKCVSSNLIRTETDAVLGQLAFIFDINFEESYDILVETDNFDLYLSSIDVLPNSEKLWRKVKEVCFDRINQGVLKKEGTE